MDAQRALKVLLLVMSMTWVNRVSAQEITKEELMNSEWFVDNADTLFDMFSINVPVGDTIVFYERMFDALRPDVQFEGQQELALLGHQSYANFIFTPQSKMLYYLTTADNPFHTLVGQMPAWKWKLTGRKKVKFYQSGEYQLTIELIDRDLVNFEMGKSTLTVQKLIVVRTE